MTNTAVSVANKSSDDILANSGTSLYPLELANETPNNISFQIVRSRKRKKSISIQFINDSTLRVLAPHFLSNKDIQHFIVQKKAWINSKWQQRQQRQKLVSADEQAQQAWLFGKCYPLYIKQASKVSITLKASQLLLTLPNLTRQQSVLSKWYRAQAQSYFDERLVALAEPLPWVKTVPPLKLRAMRRRWGSCNSEGLITLNTHLIKAPKACIDYVILHELCHLQEFNHSKRFYQLMGQVCPQWQSLKAHLDHHQHLYS